MSDQKELAKRLATLNDAQLKHVCGRLLEDLQSAEEPLLTEEDRKLRQEEDRELVQEAARQTHVLPEPAANDREAAVGFLVVVADSSSEAYRSIEAALTELEAGGVKMDFGISFAATILLPAIAAAIIRPKVEYSSSQSGESRKRQFKLDVRGVKDIGSVIKKVLPFVSS